MRLLLLLAVGWCSVLAGPTFRLDDAGDDVWWKNAVIYEIYPRSFLDTDGNGIGDIQGIRNKVDYLKDLGVNAVWLGPMYPSGGMDFGYDVTNMTDIDPLFGDLSLLEKLFKELKNAGIKVIMDFVPNHTSWKHEWFNSSVYKKDGKEDYYVWADGQGQGPPSNWLSVMDGGSAWEYHTERKQYYLHNFLREQPDLNYRNPSVIEEMQKIMEFWLSKGVDGFRMDAVAWLVEAMNSDGTFPNENFVPSCSNHSDYNCITHLYTLDQVQTYDIISKFAKTLNASKENPRIMFTESYNEDMDKITQYYKAGATFPMNLRLIMNLNRESNLNDWLNEISIWLSLPNHYWPNWILGNHDNRRVGDRLWEELGDAANMLMMVLKGTAVTYQGEELVMMDSPVRYDQAQDVQGKPTPAVFASASRDPERAPFQWNASAPAAGFSSNCSTWLPVNPDYYSRNVEAQKKAAESHLSVYKKAVKLRSHPILTHHNSTCNILAVNFNVLLLERQLNSSSVFLLINLGEAQEEISLLNFYPLLEKKLFVYASSVNNPKPSSNQIETNGITLRPKGAIILTTEEIKTK